jgi:hypothetical protein
MKVRLRVLDNGTRVRIRQPRPGERGIWIVRGRVVGSGLTDPPDDLGHQRTGRPRVRRRSRLGLAAPYRRAGLWQLGHTSARATTPRVGPRHHQSSWAPAAQTGGSSDEARP